MVRLHARGDLFTGARSRSFEEIAPKLIELGRSDWDQKALKEYLLLNHLRRLTNRVEDAELSNQEVLNLKMEYNRVEANLKGLISNYNYKAVLKKMEKE
ncbi:hypothetical protein TYRP_007115 [Tyrophagus putrescentiae]|nr:hypothetical protein TYRP_007115 [Tyrophagus putrescentiae]